MMSLCETGPAATPRMAHNPFKSWAWVPLVYLLFNPAASEAPEASHHRVLMLYSFGSSFSPFDEFGTGFRQELTRLSPAPVEFFEASLETTLLSEPLAEDLLASYLSLLYQDTGIDLVVSVGGAAARFSFTHRDRLFPSTPLLVTAFERRLLAPPVSRSHTASSTVAIDIPGAIDHILNVLPATNQIIIVLGDTSVERYWVAETQRELQRFNDRVRLTWFNELSVEEMCERAADLPPHSAIFYMLLAVDGVGVPQQHDQALDRLRAVSAAPIFGLFDSEMGRGIVGGPLISIPEASRRAAETALRILNGEAPEAIRTQPLRAGAPVFDFRELERWNIPEKILPSGSKVLFRPPSLWQRYKWPVIFGLSIVGLETALIAGLLLQRDRRRRAEKKAHSLSRRLIQAHEQERLRLARELHDDLSQRLARLAIDLAGLEKRRDGASTGAEMQSVRDEVVRLSEDVHTLSYRLHPTILEDLGLIEALEAECERLARQESMAVEMKQLEVPGAIPQETALCLFRVAQESLRNVARHAQARSVEVTLRELDGGLELTIRDDGVGYDPRDRHVSGRLGLAIMRERVSLVRGELELDSAPGCGTTVSAWVPLADPGS